MSYLAIAFAGLGMIAWRFSLIFEIVRLAGIAYLLWLAVGCGGIRPC